MAEDLKSIPQHTDITSYGHIVRINRHTIKSDITTAECLTNDEIVWTNLVQCVVAVGGYTRRHNLDLVAFDYGIYIGNTRIKRDRGGTRRRR